MFDRCKVLTRRQIALIVLIAWLSGAALAVAGCVIAAKRYAPPIVPLQPMVLDAGTVSVVRLPFAWWFVERSCYVTIYRERGTWSVSC